MRASPPGNYTLVVPTQAGEDIEPREFEGDVAKREGMGGLAAIDEITMVCCPDLMTLARTATTRSFATCRAR